MKKNAGHSPYNNKNENLKTHSPSKNSKFKMKLNYFTPMSNDELLVKLNSS